MKKLLLILLFPLLSFGQFNPVSFYEYGKNINSNTFIGGVSATITTASQLATKLGISSARVSGFKIIGSNISAKITGTYDIPASCFSLDTSITYFLDNGGLVLGLNSNAFNGCSNLVTVSFPNCNSVSISTGFFSFRNCISLVNVNLPEATHIGTQSFSGCTSLVTLNLPKAIRVGVQAFENMTAVATINLPKCLYLGNNVNTNAPGNNNVFLSIKTGCTITANIALQTNNSGSPDGDLTYAISSRSATVNYVP